MSGCPCGVPVIYAPKLNSDVSSSSSMQGPGGRGVGLALVMLTLLLLAVQYVVGMWINLYARCLPTSIQNVYNSTQCTPNIEVGAHVDLGLVLGLLSLALVVWAARRHRPHLLAAAGAGFVFILVAAFAGEEFLATGNAAYSLLMAVAFLAAFGAYLRAAAALSRHSRMGGPGSWGASGASSPP